MKVQEIRMMIEDAVREEEKSNRLANLVKEVAKRNNRSLNTQQTKDVIDYVIGYIRHVPYYIEEGFNAAQQVGLEAEMNKMVHELEVYWFSNEDLIPDHLGLVGLMDDAYASLVLLQAISDYCQSTTIGRPLLSQNLSHANQAIRNLIGEPIASQLDARIGVTISQAMMQRLLDRITSAGAFSFGAGPDPIWGNASIDEIVDVRLGAMGVVK